MACPKEAGERGWTPIFAGSSASATRAVSVRSARTSRSSSGGSGAPTPAGAGGGGGPRGPAFGASVGYVSGVPPAERETSLANLKLERDAIALYDRLAAIEPDPHRAHALP